MKRRKLRYLSHVAELILFSSDHRDPVLSVLKKSQNSRAVPEKTGFVERRVSDNLYYFMAVIAYMKRPVKQKKKNVKFLDVGRASE